MKLRKEIVVHPHHATPVGCVLVLPGRGVPGSLMERFMEHTGLSRSLKVILEPENLQWYPAPNGPSDQVGAVWGQAYSRKILEEAIKRIEASFGFTKKDICIVGFSAGAVMAIQLLAYSDKPYAGILSLAGAILAPEQLPKAPFNTPVALHHYQDDDCFKWDERYLPMKKALVSKGYNVEVVEGVYGGHNLNGENCEYTRNFVAKQFGYFQDFDVLEAEADDDGDVRTDHDIGGEA